MKTNSRTSSAGARDRGEPRDFKAIERRLNPRHRKLTTTGVISRRMGVVKQRGTAPELIVRGVVASMGLRYRTRNADLPGSPDLANRSRRWVIFVHGCYWHAHAHCSRATVPRRNREFWINKFRQNVARDQRVQTMLRSQGFKVAIVWECETQNFEHTIDVLRRFFRLQ